MRTSTYRLSKSQQIIFAVVLTLAILFGGCSDSITDDGTVTPADEPTLKGQWVDLDSSKRGRGASTHNLTFDRSVGTYQVQDLSENNECGIYPAESKVFDYEITGINTLRLDIKHHAICGVEQQTGVEEAYFSLSNDNLRIFNKTFIREESLN